MLYPLKTIVFPFKTKLFFSTFILSNFFCENTNTENNKQKTVMLLILKFFIVYILLGVIMASNVSEYLLLKKQKSQTDYFVNENDNILSISRLF